MLPGASISGAPNSYSTLRVDSNPKILDLDGIVLKTQTPLHSSKCWYKKFNSTDYVLKMDVNATVHVFPIIFNENNKLNN